MELDPHGAAEVLAALDRIEARDAVPHIEAAERRRLAAHAAGAAPPARFVWSPHTVDGWYLGLRSRPGAAPIGEAGRLDGGTVDAVLAATGDAGAARVWLRGTDPGDVRAAADAGWLARRTLLVLGMALDDDATVPPAPPGLRLAPWSDVGTAAVARLLERAYAGPQHDGLVETDPDAGPWTAERIERLAAAALADPSDLLVGVDDGGEVAGLHWTGRRAGAVGEVFNLAVDPGFTGRGVAAWLLGAGLAHLRDVGHREVLLWVDERNAPARALYDRAGFAERGRDVALQR